MAVVRRRFDTTDLEVAVDALATAFEGGNLRVSDSTERFRYSQEYVGAPELAIVSQTIDANIDSSSNGGQSMVLAWSYGGSTAYRHGSQELAMDRGVLWSGVHPVGTSIDRATVATISLDRALFEGHAAALLGREYFALPHFFPLPAPESTRAVRHHFAALRALLLRDLVTEHPLVWRSTLDLSISVILAAAGLDENTAADARMRPNVRRALAYIDENLDRPVSLADIARASGSSARSLESAFRRSIGLTPIAVLRRGRLARAHDELRAVDPDSTTVAAVARRWGFANLGRFARAYRETYGENPSDTLRR